MFKVVAAERPKDVSDGVHETRLARLDHLSIRRWDSVGAPLCVVAGYWLLGIVAFWPALPKMSTHLFTLPGYPDFPQASWFIAWVPHALAHLSNPFFSHAIFQPNGVNLGSNTASPLLGLISVPLAIALNPIARANLLLIVAMPVSATAAFAVLRRWQVSLPASSVGGLIYGFSPYMISQTLGHLELTFVPLPPLIAAVIVSVFQRRGSPWRTGIQLGLLVSAQYLISPEVLASVAVLTIVALAWAAIFQRHLFNGMRNVLLSPAVIAIAVAGALLVYPIWMLLLGPQHIRGPTWPPGAFPNDFLSFVAPGGNQHFAFGMRSLGYSLDPRVVVESGGYIGIPVLVLTGALAYRSRRRARSQLALVLLIVGAVLSLGPHLIVDGFNTHIPLPFAIVDHIPLLNNVLATRMSLEVNACLAAVIAFGLDDIRRRPAGIYRHERGPSWRTRERRSRTISILALLVLIVTQLPRSPYRAAPYSALPNTIQQAIPGGDPITITYPDASMQAVQPLVWQLEDGFGFRLISGYAYHPLASSRQFSLNGAMEPMALQDFFAGEQGDGPVYALDEGLIQATRVILLKYDVRVVIVDRSFRGSALVERLFDNAIGPPMISTTDYSFWRPDDVPLTRR